ncbi:peptidase S41, partial [mine drainage metagenome]
APGPVQALIRYPSIHDDTVVFEAGGAVWKVGVQGGEATRLTSDSGYDSHPLLSPDGKWVAFTGWYRGNTDVYVVSVNGGPVKQLTWRSINAQMHGKIMPAPDNVVIGWTPNSEDVVFLSRRESFNPQIERAFEVPVTGGLPVALPMPWTGRCRSTPAAPWWLTTSSRACCARSTASITTPVRPTTSTPMTLPAAPARS